MFFWGFLSGLSWPHYFREWGGNGPYKGCYSGGMATASHGTGSPWIFGADRILSEIYCFLWRCGKSPHGLVEEGSFFLVRVLDRSISLVGPAHVGPM